MCFRDAQQHRSIANITLVRQRQVAQRFPLHLTIVLSGTAAIKKEEELRLITSIHKCVLSTQPFSTV